MRAPTRKGAGAAQIIAKCETRQSLFNFKSIASAADGIILSRGNLGLDVLPEKMALVQKSVISNCNLIGKPVLITRVVDTMCIAPRPTRCGRPGTYCRVKFRCPKPKPRPNADLTLGQARAHLAHVAHHVHCAAAHAVRSSFSKPLGQR